MSRDRSPRWHVQMWRGADAYNEVFTSAADAGRAIQARAVAGWTLETYDEYDPARDRWVSRLDRPEPAPPPEGWRPRTDPDDRALEPEVF